MKVTIEDGHITVDGFPVEHNPGLSDMANATLDFLRAMAWAANRLHEETTIAHSNQQAVWAIEAVRGWWCGEAAERTPDERTHGFSLAPQGAYAAWLRVEAERQRDAYVQIRPWWNFFRKTWVHRYE